MYLLHILILSQVSRSIRGLCFKGGLGENAILQAIRYVLIKGTSISLKKKFSGGCFLQARLLIEIVVMVLIILMSMEIWSPEIMENRFCYTTSRSQRPQLLKKFARLEEKSVDSNPREIIETLSTLQSQMVQLTKVLENIYNQKKE